MKKINYKGRCEKRKVSKCEDICRTYSKIQSAMVDMLENNDDVVSFECNVRLKGVAEDLYSSDFVIKKSSALSQIFFPISTKRLRRRRRNWSCGRN